MRDQLIALKEAIDETLNAEDDFNTVVSLLTLNQRQNEMAQAIREWTHSWNERMKNNEVRET